MPLRGVRRRQQNRCLVPFAVRCRSVMRHDQDRHCSALGSLLERAGLPVSSTTHLTGIVERAANGPVLRTDGGGTWELDNTRQVRKFIGSRVEVVGERSGFNGFACDQIWPAGHRRPTAFKLRLEFILAAAFVTYGLYATVGAAISALG